MAFLNQTTNNQGMFVPEAVIYDTRNILSIDVSSDEFKQLLVRLYQSINNISINLNKKEIALYPLEEINTGVLYYREVPTQFEGLRTVYRTTYQTGALGAGVTNIAHGLTITNQWEFTKIQGVANDPVGFRYYPIPMTLLTVSLTATNIVITNGTGINFNTGSIVLEYVKNL